MSKFTLTKKDFEITWFSGSGAGGQHRNKHNNCIRIKHPPTGVIVTGQSHKERLSNQKEAMKSLVNNPKFKSWCDLKLREIEMGKTVEQMIDEDMRPENLKVEYLSKKSEEG